jgi:large subunit ribosomal protein L6
MKKNLEKKLKIPEGTKVEIDGTKVKVKGKEGEIEKEFRIKNMKIEKKENEIIISGKNATKREKKMMNTIAAHIKNMIEGADKKFEYKLKICYSHFPMTIEMKGDEAMIKNFLGERIARKAKIMEGVNVNVNREIIEISSANKEAAGQTAANFEKATWIRLRDRRVFQDGIFITEKPGREK